MADTVAAERLGTTLRRVGYSEDAVHRLLGEEAYSSERGDTPADERRLPDTPLATLLRLLFLQLPVSAQDAEVVLGRESVAALDATGLAEIGVPRTTSRPTPRRPASSIPSHLARVSTGRSTSAREAASMPYSLRNMHGT